MAKLKNDNENPGAVFVPAGVIGGMGVGFAVNNLPAGMFIGLGLGFAAMAITGIMLAKKK